MQTYDERPCVRFCRIKLDNPMDVADFILWLCYLGPEEGPTPDFLEIGDIADRDELMELQWGFEAPRHRMAKLLWQTVQRDHSEEHFHQEFCFDRCKLTEDSFDCGSLLAPIQSRLRLIIKASSERLREDRDIGQGDWGEAFWLPPEHSEYVRQQIRGATLDLVEQAAEYPECLRLELDYLLVHKIRGIEVPGSGLERTYSGYHRVDRYSRYFTFVEVEADGRRYPLIDAQHPYRYAAGYDFTWGYAGAGPSRLAVSILADATDGDIELARRLREDFLKEKLINLPQNKDISIPHREVLEWMRTKGPPGEEIRRASQGVRQRLQQFSADIKNLSDRLEVIHENGPLRSQRFDVVPRDFESALYVDLVQMLQKNGFVLYCNGCALPISCNDSPGGHRRRGLQSSGRPVYHQKCAKEKALERKRKYWRRRSQSPRFQERRRLEARRRRRVR